MRARWKEVLVNQDASMKDVVKVIDSAALQIALVVDQENKLIGTVTDGDIRRGILSGFDINSSVMNVVNKKPLYMQASDDTAKILSVMKQKRIHQIPIVDTELHVIGIESLDELLQPQKKNNWVVIMAGGLGTRLRPLTDNCPKPMLDIDKYPILEDILVNFINHGFVNFFFSVNYLSEHIKKYFGNGDKWNVKITYLEENKKLGTAGSLSLLPTSPDNPFFVMNGDVMARVNFNAMLDYHSEHKTCATMGVREYTQTIPYGVVSLDQYEITEIIEKPTKKYFVNSGIYILEPELLERIPHNQYFDMPTLFQQLRENEKKITGFPVHEYWLDIGRVEDLEKARVDSRALRESGI